MSKSTVLCSHSVAMLLTIVFKGINDLCTTLMNVKHRVGFLEGGMEESLCYSTVR